MREKWQKQMPLMAHIKDHPQSKELEAISTIIDATTTICEKVLQVHPTKAYLDSWSPKILSLKNSLSLKPYACF